MCGLGATEMMIILILALLVFGPSKLPELAKGVGKALREFKKASKDLKDQVSSDEELGAAMREVEAARMGVTLPEGDSDKRKKVGAGKDEDGGKAKAKAKEKAKEKAKDADEEQAAAVEDAELEDDGKQG